MDDPLSGKHALKSVTPKNPAFRNLRLIMDYYLPGNSPGRLEKCCRGLPEWFAWTDPNRFPKSSKRCIDNVCLPATKERRSVRFTNQTTAEEGTKRVHELSSFSSEVVSVLGCSLVSSLFLNDTSFVCNVWFAIDHQLAYQSYYFEECTFTLNLWRNLCHICMQYLSLKVYFLKLLFHA